jgi:hypothetical protein
MATHSVLCATVLAMSIAGCGGTTDIASTSDRGAGDGANTKGTGPCGSSSAGPVRLATAKQPSAIAIDAANVYWVDSALGTVNAVPSCGGATKTLVTTSALGSSTLIPAGIAVQGGDVYFTTQDPWNPDGNDGAVWKVPVAGGTPTRLVQDLDRPGPIVVTAATMVWINSWKTFSADGQILQAPLDGRSMTVLASAQNGPLALAFGGGTAVWTISGYVDSERGSIVETPVGGGVVDGIVAGLGVPVGVAVEGTYVYWVDQGDPNVANSGRVMKTPLDPKAAADPIKLVSGGAPQGIAVDAAHVYFTDSQSQSVNMVALAGGATTTLATQQVAPLVMAVDDTNVYWTTVAEGVGQGSIMKMAK